MIILEDTLLHRSKDVSESNLASRSQNAKFVLKLVEESHQLLLIQTHELAASSSFDGNCVRAREE